MFPRALALVSTTLVILGCACGEFTRGFQQGFDQNFDQGFRTSFVESCVSGGGAADPAMMRRICTCSADELIARYTPTELMTISTNAEEPENKAKIEAAVAACAPK